MFSGGIEVEHWLKWINKLFFLFDIIPALFQQHEPFMNFAACRNMVLQILIVIDDNVALLARRCSDWGTRNRHQRIFRKVLTIRKR